MSSFLNRVALTGRSCGSVLRRSTPSLTVSPVRCFSGSAREKLQAVMEDYRKKNYGQELPSRFAKEVTKAADTDGDGFISVSELEKLLENIGAKDVLKHEEIEDVLSEIGNNQGEKGVPIQAVVDYVRKSSKSGVS